jgi:hypothetical protein
MLHPEHYLPAGGLGPARDNAVTRVQHFVGGLQDLVFFACGLVVTKLAATTGSAAMSVSAVALSAAPAA